MQLPQNLVWQTFLHAIGVLLYTTLAATVMSNGEALFGDDNTIWSLITFLMFFVLSATVTGLLVLGKPVTLFLSGDKKEAVTFLVSTIA